MILEETEVMERMNSPLNLLNRLKSLSNRHDKSHNIIPSLPPTSKDVIENLDEKLAYGSIKSKASNIMIAALDELKAKITDVDKPGELSKIAESMSKIVNAEVKDNKGDENKPQFILYAPQFHNENHYEVIHARE